VVEMIVVEMIVVEMMVVEMMGLEPTTPCLQSQIGQDRDHTRRR
jgi:hypothetical protein